MLPQSGVQGAFSKLKSQSSSPKLMPAPSAHTVFAPLVFGNLALLMCHMCKVVRNCADALKKLVAVREPQSKEKGMWAFAH